MFKMMGIFEELAVFSDICEGGEQRHILASLPESYSMFITALKGNLGIPQMEVFTERLLHVEKSKRMVKEMSESSFSKALSDTQLERVQNVFTA